MSQRRKIYLLGATGYTGELTARRLASLGLDVTIAGRDEEKLRALAGELGLASEAVLFDASAPGTLVERLEPGAIVVNCVGPFGLFSPALLDALVGRELIYLDVTGEQSFVLDSLERRHERALESGACVVHSCAFESFLADLLAESLGVRDEPLLEISSYYWFDRMLASPGTRLTMALSERWRTVSFREGELRDERAGAARDMTALGLAGDQTHAVFVPYPEVVFFSRRFDTENAGSHLLVKPSAVRFFDVGRAEAVPSVDELLRRHARQAGRGPSETQRMNQGFGVAVVADSRSGERKLAVLEGRDPYGITAAILGWCCVALLARDEVPPGIGSPAEVFPFQPFFEDLAAWPEYFERLSRDRSRLDA